jgi:hypothetical protein
MGKVENANTNLATQDAVYVTKRFLRMLAQPYEPVCLHTACKRLLLMEYIPGDLIGEELD